MQTDEYRLTNKQTNMQTNVIIKQKFTKIRDILELASERKPDRKDENKKTIQNLNN
jgi:hypothetical protein